MLSNKDDLNTCGLSYTFNAIGGKWKPFIIWYLNASETGVCRYGELKRNIPWNISHKMFTQQLSELEQVGIVNRVEYNEKPLRVEYSLTEAGKLLAPAILYLRDWGCSFGDFTEEDLMRSMGGREKTGVFTYGAQSEALGKGVEITYAYGKTENKE